jgi:hypothetical protein
MDPILAGIQATLDAENEGWQVAGYVAIIGCERIIDGRIQYAPYMCMASDQPGWVTTGLLNEASGFQSVTVEDGDGD